MYDGSAKKKHKRKFNVSQFCSDRYLLKQTIHIESSTENTFIVHLQVDTQHSNNQNKELNLLNL